MASTYEEIVDLGPGYWSRAFPGKYYYWINHDNDEPRKYGSVQGSQWQIWDPYDPQAGPEEPAIKGEALSLPFGRISIVLALASLGLIKIDTDRLQQLVADLSGDDIVLLDQALSETTIRFTRTTKITL